MPKTFRLGERAPVWWPVEFSEAMDDGGTESYRFRARFRRLTAAELKQAADDDVDMNEFLRAHVIDWDGPEDSEGSAVPFSADALEDALEHLPVREALITALFEVSRGGGERKNSRTSRGR